MQIHNAIITGSFSYNGADLSNVTSSNAYSASLSSRVTQIETVYATTGSNSFRANQSITGSLTVSGSTVLSGSVAFSQPVTASAFLTTGTITAQTLVVSTVSSSIEYASGSNIFGNNPSLNTQTFTGSLYQTGSVASFSTCVGIGLNPGVTPSARLHVKRPDGVGVNDITWFSTGNDAVGDGVSLKFTTGDTTTSVARIDAVKEGTNLGTIRFNTGLSTNTYQEIMRLAQGSACFNVIVQSCDKVGTADNKGFYLRGTTDSTHRLYYNSSDGSNVWEYNVPIKFNYYNSASPATRMLFDTSGNACFSGRLCTETQIVNRCLSVGAAQDPNDVLTVYGSTNQGINICASDQPRLGFFVGGTSADNKIWDFIPQSNNTFIARAVNDAKSSTATWLNVTRSGITITSICFPQTNPVVIMGCLGIGIVPNAPGVRIAQDNTLRVEGSSGANNCYGISLGGHGFFSIDAPGVGGGRFYINDSGDVGIGETSPSTYGRLVVSTSTSNNSVPIFTLGYGTTLSNLVLRNQYTRASGILNGIEFRDSSNEVQASIYACATGTNNQSNLIFGTNNGTGGNGLTGASNRLTITAAGNVGINSSSPSEKLYLRSGNFRMFDPSSIVNAGYDIQWASCNGGSDVSYAIINAITDNSGCRSGNLRFYTSNNAYPDERFRITSDGRSYFTCQLAVGQTGSPQANITLDVVTAGCVANSTPSIVCQGCQSGIRVYNNVGATNNSLVGIWFQTSVHMAGIGSGRCDASAGWGTDLRFFTHPQATDNYNYSCERMRINTEGTITFFTYGSGTLTTNSAGVISASDGRLKTKTRCIKNGLCTIMQLNPTYYNWNEGTEFHTEYEELGFIAQEVACVIPEASPEPEEENKFKNYSDRAIIAMLTKGMQEQQCKIALLESCLGIS